MPPRRYMTPIVKTWNVRRTDDEFMAMYEQYEVFDALEDEFLEKRRNIQRWLPVM